MTRLLIIVAGLRERPPRIHDETQRMVGTSRRHKVQDDVIELVALRAIDGCNLDIACLWHLFVQPELRGVCCEYADVGISGPIRFETCNDLHGHEEVGDVHLRAACDCLVQTPRSSLLWPSC